MREILFRGKRLDNGEWAEGNFYESGISGVFILQSKTRKTIDAKKAKSRCTKKRYRLRFAPPPSASTPICSLDKPFEAEVLGTKVTVYCKPFEQFQDILRQSADVIGVLVSAFIRLGKFGKLFVDYKGDPRGHMGRDGDLPLEDQVFLMGTLVDVDGGRWVPVQEDLLMELVEKAKAADVAPVRHGKWEWDTEYIYRCSNCAEKSRVKEVMGRPAWGYCPNCGAKMDGEDQKC